MPELTPSQEVLRHPMAETLLRFESLISCWLHPQRVDASLSPADRILFDQAQEDEALLNRLHRHWSARLIQDPTLPAVVMWSDPALPLALLPQEHWSSMIALGGAVLLATQVRQTIVAVQVQALQAFLGADLLALVRNGDPAWPTLDVSILKQPNTKVELPQACAAWGESLLWKALQGADPGIRERAQLRLPARAEAFAHQSLSALPTRSALDLSLSLIPRLDPKWLSTFHATH
jgi:hypothetical protein